ncbi:MAG TPA: thiamine pyrophosphate-dependent enzyme, partial [Candidatus Paceibacterota bacterium]|nr:thiamine pyrophosphate-dependent enzyme [Candidatus Paceibacterota bacterium]
HIKQGKITEKLLDVLSIPHIVLSADMAEEKMSSDIFRLVETSKKENCPCAIIVKSGLFEPYIKLKKETSFLGSLGREEAVGMVLDSLDGSEIVVSTTGKISRELYESRKKRDGGSGKDFLTVGSMGHASQIALGISHNKKDKQVYCLDGDGAVIMHMGSLATTGWVAPHNFKHIILNNMAHESVGGQPTAAEVIDLPGIAKSCKYSFVSSVSTGEELKKTLATFKTATGPALLEIKVGLGSRKDLGRPTESPVENKKKFMDFVGR